MRKNKDVSKYNSQKNSPNGLYSQSMSDLDNRYSGKELEIEAFIRAVITDKLSKGRYTKILLDIPFRIDDDVYHYVYIRDKAILHVTRDSKGNKTIPLPKLLNRMYNDVKEIQNWRYDNQNNTYLIASRYSNDYVLKYVFRKTAKGILYFVTAGIVRHSNFTQYPACWSTKQSA